MDPTIQAFAAHVWHGNLGLIRVLTVGVCSSHGGGCRGIPKQCLGVLGSLVGDWSLPLTQHSEGSQTLFGNSLPQTHPSQIFEICPTNAYPTSTRRNILAALVACSAVLQDDRLQTSLWTVLLSKKSLDHPTSRSIVSSRRSVTIESRFAAREIHPLILLSYSKTPYPSQSRLIPTHRLRALLNGPRNVLDQTGITE